MFNHEQTINEIQRVMANWTKALKLKDVEAMHKDYAEKFCAFDVMETVNSVDDFKALWQKCFPYFDQPEIEYKDFDITASENMAVVHFKSRMKGMICELPEEMANAWLRGTICFRKIDNNWKCFHEHYSFPVNCETNQIAYDAAK